MQTTNPFIEKSSSGIPSGGYQYTYVLNNPLKYTDPSGYKKLNQYEMEELRVSEFGFAGMMSVMNSAYYNSYGGGGGGGNARAYAQSVDAVHQNPAKWSYNFSTGVYSNSQTGEQIDGKNQSPTEALSQMGVTHNSIHYERGKMIGTNGWVGKDGQVYGKPVWEYNKINDSKFSTGKILAALLRKAPFFYNPGSPVPFVINPFFGAEAIMIDGGTTVAGAEVDGGAIFMLAGKDRGKIKLYGELAAGFGTDIGVGVEISRIDFTGFDNDLMFNVLEGERSKFYGGVNIFEALSVGGAFSISGEKNARVYGSSVQFGIGASIFGIINFGYNNGVIKIMK